MKSKTLTLSVPHRLSQDEARARIAAGVADARTKYAGDFASVRENWSGNRMDFDVGVLGQSITGRVDVGPDAVLLEVDLPWILAALAGRVRPQIEQQARKMLQP